MRARGEWAGWEVETGWWGEGVAERGDGGAGQGHGEGQGGADGSFQSFVGL